MARIAYVNGRYLPLARATVGIEDRGLQFADGVYEVIKVVGGAPRDLERHFARLQRSLGELEIAMPVSPAALRQIITQLIARNRLRTAIVYLQIDRGRAPRSHLFPVAAKPSLIVTVRRAPLPRRADLEEGVAVLTMADERWARCDIKSVALLPNVRARQKAFEQGCREAWLVDADGLVTEGSSANAYIVDAEGRVVTRPLGHAILGGVTRSVVLDLAREAGIEVVERAFTVDEALAAREAFLTSTSSLVLPVTSIDGQVIGNGRPGSITAHLLELYERHCGLRGDPLAA